MIYTGLPPMLPKSDDVYLSNGTHLHVIDKPIVSYGTIEKLKSIHPYMYPEWDWNHGRWVIMFKSPFNLPYAIMPVCDLKTEKYQDIDKRTFDHLHKSMEFSKRAYKNLWDMLDKNKEVVKKKEQDEYNRFFDFSQEYLSAPGTDLLLAGNSSHTGMHPRSTGWSPE